MFDLPQSPWLRFDFRPDIPDVEQSSTPLIFAHPEQIIVAYQESEVLPALQRVQEATDAGYYAAGFVGYEAAPAFDSAMRVQSAPAPADFPLLWFGIFAHPQSAPTAEAEPAPPADSEPDESGFSEWTPSVSRREYDEAIAAIREAIARGETYQVNYTLRLRASLRGADYALYTRLLRAQAGRYGAYLNVGRYHILSASPELFFYRQGGHIVTRPMKGTIARGRWQEEDQEQARELANSEKNRAENIMIVDLLRNDLGRIALPGSVQVSDLFRLERYPNVWQMTSTVEANIPPATTLSEIFRALFPCGSVTGAPKIQTMRHIAALETAPRNVYCGAIGLIKPYGTATFNVAIRTILVDTHTGIAEYGAGGGITWDSTAGGEYAELLAKAAVLHEATPDFDLLETLRLEEGEFWLWKRHWQRVRETAEYFGFRHSEQSFLYALNKIAQKHGSGNWRVRLRVSARGKASAKAFPLEPNAGTPLPFVLATSPIASANRFLYHKTTHREVYQQHIQETRQRVPNVYDTLLWNERGELTEFTTGNLVVELEGCLWTPPRDSGLLAGTFRAELLTTGEIFERVLTPADLKQATAIWLINSVRGWLPVRFVTYIR